MITYEEQINQFKADFHLAQDELDDIIKIHEIPIFIEYKRDDIHDFTDKPSLYEELVYIIEGKSYDKPGIEEKYKHRRDYIFHRLEEMYPVYTEIMDSLVHNACYTFSNISLVKLTRLYSEVISVTSGKDIVSIQKLPEYKIKEFPKHLMNDCSISFLIAIISSFNNRKNLNIQLKNESTVICCKPIQVCLSPDCDNPSLIELEVLSTTEFNKRQIIRLDEIEYIESYNLYGKLQKITRENLPTVTIDKTLLEFIISSRNSDRYYKTFHDILFAETYPSILDFRRLRD